MTAKHGVRFGYMSSLRARKVLRVLPNNMKGIKLNAVQLTSDDSPCRLEYLIQICMVPMLNVVPENLRYSTLNSAVPYAGVLSMGRCMVLRYVDMLC